MLFGSRYVHPTPDDAAHQAAPVAYEARVRGPLRGLSADASECQVVTACAGPIFLGKVTTR